MNHSRWRMVCLHNGRTHFIFAESLTSGRASSAATGQKETSRIPRIDPICLVSERPARRFPGSFDCVARRDQRAGHPWISDPTCRLTKATWPPELAAGPASVESRSSPQRPGSRFDWFSVSTEPACWVSLSVSSEPDRGYSVMTAMAFRTSPYRPCHLSRAWAPNTTAHCCLMPYSRNCYSTATSPIRREPPSSD